MKFPKTLGACVDTLYKLREDRLKLQEQADHVKAQEEALRQHILNSFEKGDIEGARGKLATANVTQRVVAQVEDWDALFAFVAKEKAFHLLQRRVSDVAYREFLDNKVEVPGAKPFTVTSLSLTKR